MKIWNVGLSVLPQFIWSLFQNRSYRDFIMNVTCCVNCFCPEDLSNVSLIDHGSGHFLQCSLLSFYNSILLGSSRTREVMQDAFLIKEWFKKFIFKFPTMITSDFNNSKFFFVLDLVIESREQSVTRPCVLRTLPMFICYSHLQSLTHTSCH